MISSELGYTQETLDYEMARLRQQIVREEQELLRTSRTSRTSQTHHRSYITVLECEYERLKRLEPTISNNRLYPNYHEDPWFNYDEEKVDDSNNNFQDLVMSPSIISNTNKGTEDLIRFEETESPIIDDNGSDEEYTVYWHWTHTPKQGSKGTKIDNEQDYYQHMTFKTYNEFKEWETNHLQKCVARILMFKLDGLSKPKEKRGHGTWIDNIIKHFKLDISMEKTKKEQKRLVERFIKLGKNKGVEFRKNPKGKWLISSCNQLVIEDHGTIEQTALLTTTYRSSNRKDKQLNSLLGWTTNFHKSKKRFVYDMFGKSDSELEKILDKVLECRRLNS